jgi:hypothetical protein
MKTMMKLTAVFCSLLLQIGLFGQIEPPGTGDPVTLKSGSDMSKQKPVGSHVNSGTGLIGANTALGKESGLFFNDWSSGTVVLTDNTVITDHMLRYDIYHRQMQFAYNGDTAAFGKPEEVRSITFNHNTFVYEEFMCKDGKRKDYLEVLVEGDCRLLLYRCIQYKLVDECTIPGAENPKEEYYQIKKYFLSKNKKLAEPLPEQKNDVIEMLSDKGKDIKSFMQTNKTKLTDEQDLIKLVNFYNEN